MTTRSTLRSLGDPFRGSVLLAVLLIGAGFVVIVLGWRGSATTLDVAEQLTYLVSAGITSLALIATGLTILLVQRARRIAAGESHVLTRLVGAVTASISEQEVIPR